MPIEANAAATHSTCRQRCAGLTAHVKPKDAMQILGTIYKGADLIAIYQGFLDKRTAVDRKRTELNLAIAENRDALAQRKQLDNGLRAWVVNHFGEASPEAHDFGFPPRKARRVQTAAEKASAAALRQATREARGVIGTRKRAAIRGTVPNPGAPADEALAPEGAPAVDAGARSAT